jgi:hypothetical protein
MNNIVGDTTNDPIRDQSVPRADRMCVELPTRGLDRHATTCDDGG